MPDTPKPEKARNGGLIARLGARVEKYRNQSSHFEGQVAELTKKNKELTTQVQELGSRADNSASAKRVDELLSELRGLKHRAVFDKAAKARGARDEALDDLWALSGYKPEGDQADETVLGQLIDDQKSKRSYLFADPKAEGQEAPPAEGTHTPPPKPAPGRGMGGPTGAIRKFTDAQLNDPAFVMSNHKAIEAAAKERIDRGEL